MSTQENHNNGGDGGPPKIVKEFGAYKRTRVEQGGVMRETVEEKHTRVTETLRPPDRGGRA